LISNIQESLGISFSDSISLQLRLDVEWSVIEQSILWIKSVLSSLDCINVKDLPGLVDSIVSMPDLNVLTFNISVSSNVKNLAILYIDDL